MKLRVFAFVLLVVLAAGVLEAQSPPYGGYNPAPPYYSVGPYQGTSMYCSNFAIKQGTTILQQNGSGAAPTPYHTYYGGVTPANLVPNGTYTIEVTMSGSYPAYATCWIDYDNDGDFLDTGEYLGQSTTSASSGTVSLMFTVPAGAGGGVKRVRMRTNYSTPATHPSNTYSYGESEDYLVNLGFAIDTPSPLPSGAQGLAYSVDITAANGVTPYSWQGSPSYVISGALPPGLTASALGNLLRIAGTPTATGTSTFTLSVNDSSATPQNATKQFQLTIMPTPVALPFSDDFSTDKGWQLNGPWARGPATAFSQASPACSEPGTDHTAATSDNYILGDTIGGTYAANDSNVYWAVSPPVNCNAATSVRLRFWRWLGLAIGSTARIDVTNNGSTWTTVWTSTSGVTYGGTTSPVWSSDSFDISSVAMGYAVVQVRFGIGPTGATTSTGWCIDDLMIEQPGTDMEVRENGSTGPIITDNEAVGGGRDFGVIAVSTQSAPLTIYFTNNGPTPITFGTMTKTGAQPNDFYVNAASLANPLAVGASTSFTITFYRTTAGVSTATISLPHNAAYSGTSPFDINVKGEAVVPQPLIQVNLGSATGPQVTHQQSAAGTPRDFGNWDINAGASPSITLFITNVGTGTLSIATPDMGGVWWTEFVVNSIGMVSQLAPGQSTSFTVAFDPSSVGQKDAYVRIPHTDGTQPSPYYIPVAGNAVSFGGPVLRVHEGAPTGPLISHDDPPAGGRDFGNQLVAGGPTAPLTITIENGGGAVMTLTSPVLTGTNPGEFVLNTAGFQTSLTPGQNTGFEITFDPTSAGVKLAQVTFAHNDTAVTSPFVINVGGSGTITPTELRVTVQPTNTPKNQIVTPAPTVAITDAVGNIDTTDNTTQVQVAITTGTGNANATLTGVVTATAVNGEVTFGDLAITHSGQDYTLTFTDITGSYGTVISDPFTITGGGGGNGGDGEDEQACSTGTTRGVGMIGILALVLLARRRRASRS